MAKCVNCGIDVSFRKHYKVTRELFVSKIIAKGVYCSVECYLKKNKEIVCDE